MPRVLIEEVESVSGINNLFQHIPGVSAKFVVFITEFGTRRWTWKKKYTFLNSEAVLRIVVDIGGGSVACRARTDYEGKVSRNLGLTRECDQLSVNGGIHFSTEYGKLSISAQRPRIAECSVRRDSA